MSEARDRDEGEARYVKELIERILDECPRRAATSADERRAQELLARELEARGVATRLEPFLFNDSLYKTLALHFGVGLAGSALFGPAPALALVLHALAGLSYLGETSQRRFVLRRLLPQSESQNLVATLPSAGEPELRVVLVAHADAAFTGLLFDPRLVSRFAGPPPASLEWLLRKPLRTAALSQLALAALDGLGLFLGPGRRALYPAVAALSVPAALAFALTGEVALRDEVVPGAADDLTGCAALPLLASRLGPDKPAEVELVFVATGAEEAGRGGAAALLDQKRHLWDPRRTVVLGLDTLSNGELFYFIEGEIFSKRPPGWLEDAIAATAAADPRFARVRPFEINFPGTDANTFLWAGWDAVCLGTVDLACGSPRHYHQPTDTLENVDPEQVVLAVDFAEALVREIFRRRVTATPASRGEP